MLRTAPHMVGIAQLVRASDCGSEGRGFESRYPPFPSISLQRGEGVPLRGHSVPVRFPRCPNPVLRPTFLAFLGR